MTPIELHQDLLKAAVIAMPRDELSAVRRAAFDRFSASGFPSTRHEDWKYTSLSDAAAVSNAWLKGESVANAHAVDTGVIARIDAHWLTFRNGVIDSKSLDDLRTLSKSGIRVSRLADGVDQELIDIDDPISAFNAALLQDGIRLQATDDSTPDKPIGFLLIDDGSVPVSQLRILIDVDNNARLKVVECAVSAGSDRQFATTVTQALLGDSAKLDYVRIQQRQKDHLGVNRFDATLGHDAVLDYSNFEFGGGLTRNDIVGNVVSPGASVRLRGLFLASGRQHIDNHTRVDHRVGPATSSGEYRGILNGRARCVFNGKVIVHAGADGTDADQSNHNLLLSEKAEIDTKPELEIYADDVKCSHGATVGQMDKAALFYLRSRGLEKDEAQQVLTRAFAATILGKVPVVECHDYLAAIVDSELDALIDDDDERTP